METAQVTYNTQPAEREMRQKKTTAKSEEESGVFEKEDKKPLQERLTRSKTKADVVSVDVSYLCDSTIAG